MYNEKYNEKYNDYQERWVEKWGLKRYRNATENLDNIQANGRCYKEEMKSSAIWR